MSTTVETPEPTDEKPVTNSELRNLLAEQNANFAAARKVELAEQAEQNANFAAAMKAELADVKAEMKNLATSDELSRIRTRLEDFEQTTRIIQRTPYRPEPMRHVHREEIGGSVSGPIYR